MEGYAITPEYVSMLDAPTEGFLCSLSANVYNIAFNAFKIRAIEDNAEHVLLEIRKDPSESGPPHHDSDDSVRTIQYNFGPAMLEYRNIGTTLELTVGDTPVQNFRMIERHYFRGLLIKSYDFSLPFVIPNTTNTWEVIYSVPEIDPALKQAMIESPWETRSDSFYFVDNLLVMHNKADYSFTG
eukprot:TRINITY_DN13380_c0_g1_i1.p1 TRINITY_DN13380_c0_g1~~TRINITY_DN13380_c0_g1_i1.p1  ORF type:complete len:210 (-),score=29.02 TRINITY_DN13380_c0_g1_i1:163-714(-)